MSKQTNASVQIEAYVRLVTACHGTIADLEQITSDFPCPEAGPNGEPDEAFLGLEWRHIDEIGSLSELLEAAADKARQIKQHHCGEPMLID